MAQLQIVDAEQLNADLTAVADAIRLKAGIQDQLAFPQGFADAIQEMQLAEQEETDALGLRLTNRLTSYSSEVEGEGATYAFRGCSSLETIELSRLSVVGSYMFQSCSQLKNARFPMAETIYMGAFASCSNLTELYIPKATKLFAQACTGCSGLQLVDCPSVAEFSDKAFFNCTALQTLILRHTAVVGLLGADVFSGTPMASGTGYIYVPSALMTAYQSAAQWSAYASQIRAIEDYPEITGGGNA